jgi:hypothetical protein
VRLLLFLGKFQALELECAGYFSGCARFCSLSAACLNATNNYYWKALMLGLPCHCARELSNVGLITWRILVHFTQNCPMLTLAGMKNNVKE